MGKINQNSSPAFSYKEKELKQATLQLFKSPSLERELFRVSSLKNQTSENQITNRLNTTFFIAGVIAEI